MTQENELTKTAHHIRPQADTRKIERTAERDEGTGRGTNRQTTPLATTPRRSFATHLRDGDDTMRPDDAATSRTSSRSSSRSSSYRLRLTMPLLAAKPPKRASIRQSFRLCHHPPRRYHRLRQITHTPSQQMTRKRADKNGAHRNLPARLRIG